MGKLWSFGDSWVHGQGGNRNETFTKHIADYFELEDYNMGWNGFNNKGIINLVNISKYNINKRNDMIIVALTTPHRDESNLKIHMRNKTLKRDFDIILQKWPSLLKDLYKSLEGYNFKITQAFNPIFGYDYIIGEQLSLPNFIEWGKPNNTLLDIITDNWCEDNDFNWFMSEKRWGGDGHRRLKVDEDKVFASDKKHPSQYGHKLIAKKLIPYLEYR